VVRKWLLPTLTEILTKAESTAVEPLSLGQSTPETATVAQWQRALQHWQSAILALGCLLHTISANGVESDEPSGLLLCAPGLPFDGTEPFVTGIFMPTHEGQLLLPALGQEGCQNLAQRAFPIEIPLLPAPTGAFLFGVNCPIWTDALFGQR
jgi:hypothetical protein